MRWVLACAALVAACGGRTEPRAAGDVAGPATGTATATLTPTPLACAAPPDALLADVRRAPVWGVLDVAAARAIPGAAALLRALAYAPAADAVGTAAGVRVPTDARWIVYSARDSTWPTAFSLVVGHGGPAAAEGGGLRVLGEAIVHASEHVVLVAPDARRDALVAACSEVPALGLAERELGAAHVDDPAPLVLGEAGLRTLDARMRASGDGVDASVVVACEDSAACARTADELRRYVRRVNGPLVKSALRHLLDPLEAGAIRSDEARLVVELHATDEMLRAVAGTLGAWLGAPVSDGS